MDAGTVFTAAVGLLGPVAIALTLRELPRDDYRRLPTDPLRAQPAPRLTRGRGAR